MTTAENAPDDWLLPRMVLIVVTVIAALVSLVQAAVWGTICLMTWDLKYAWWLWSALIAGAVVAAMWAYNKIIAWIVESADGPDAADSPDDTTRTTA